MSEEFRGKALRMLAENNIFFEYNVQTGKIKAIYDDVLILDDVDPFGDLKTVYIDKNNIRLLKNFLEIAIESCSKEQTSFKATVKNIEKVFLIETFPRNSLMDNICGSIKNLSKILVEQEKLIELSQRDSLTGLLNRASIEKYIENLTKTKSFFIMAMLDIDFFKEINDNYGHIVGDNVLEYTARSLVNVISGSGEVGRIGGDEFILVKELDHLPSYSEIKNFCIDLRHSLRDLKSSMANTKTITGTIGAVVYPINGLDYKTLYSKVDKALYRGKTSGRNCYIIYQDALHSLINTSIPLSNTSEIEGETLDFSVFASNLLNSLVAVPTKEKAISKMDTIAFYFRASRVSIFENEGGVLKSLVSWIDEGKVEPELKLSNVGSYYNYLDEGALIVPNVFDFKKEYPETESMVLYDHGAFVLVPVGIKRASDIYFCIESFGSRRIWNKNRIMAIKIIGRILVTFFLKG